MIRLRPEQIDPLNADVQRRYCADLLQFYRRAVGDLVAQHDDQTLLTRIISAEQRGRQWGVYLHESMVRFIGLDLVMGSSFDQVPAVSRLFETPGMSIDMKVNILADIVEGQLRKDAQLARD